MERRTYLAGAAGVCALATTSTSQTASPSYAVSITDQSTDLVGGDRFDVVVEIENTGNDAGDGRPVRLLVGGNFIAVDSHRLSLAPGDATEITLGYDTYPVQSDVEFPIRVETLDDAVERTIAVAGADRGAEGELAHEITNFADEGVRGGESLEITTEFENVGGTRVNTVAQLVSVGQGAVVNETQVALDPGESQTIIFTYKTYPVKTDVEFEMAVCTPYASDTVSVSVGAKRPDGGQVGPFNVTIEETNDPVTGGDRLEVVASFSNGGTKRGTVRAELVVGCDVVDTLEFDMDGESTAIRTLGYSTYPVKQDVTFPVTVRTQDTSSTAQVSVHGTQSDGKGKHSHKTGDETVSDGESHGESKNADRPSDSNGSGDGSDGGDGGSDDTDPGSDGDDSGSDGGDDSGGGSASFGVSIDGTDAPVTGGEILHVSTTITNTGDADGTTTASLVVGGETIVSREVAVTAGGSQPYAFGYSTYPVQQDVTFPVTVRVDGASASTTVSVRGVGDSESDAENGGGADDSGEESGGGNASGGGDTSDGTQQAGDEAGGDAATDDGGGSAGESTSNTSGGDSATATDAESGGESDGENSAPSETGDEESSGGGNATGGSDTGAAGNESAS